MKNQPSPPLIGIPALVVSGFLGAGKTTLVQHLLKDAQGQGLRLAIVSNEFGALGIDQALLGNQGSNSYVELEGGCVCCKLSDELVKTLQQLWEEVQPDRIVVETSGVALPFETLINFWRDPVSEWVGDSITVVVVNAEQVAERRDLDGTFEQQVSSADLLIVNKIDLIEANQLDLIEKQLEHMAPGTPLIRATNANVESKVLFTPDPDTQANRQPDQQVPHSHEAFESEEIQVEPGIDPETLIKQVQSHQALRAKGFVETSQGLRILQGVGTRIDLIETSVHPPDHLLGRIVVIRRSTQPGSTH
ncbi:MAG: GTP-binding protein [Nitrospirales bacterium]